MSQIAWVHSRTSNLPTTVCNISISLFVWFTFLFCPLSDRKLCKNTYKDESDILSDCSIVGVHNGLICTCNFYANIALGIAIKYLSVLLTIRLIAVTFATDSHGEHRINLNDFGDPLTFHWVPQAGQNVPLSNEISQHAMDLIGTNSVQIWVFSRWCTFVGPLTFRLASLKSPRSNSIAAWITEKQNKTNIIWPRVNQRD